jgi:hypothetical protein
MAVQYRPPGANELELGWTPAWRFGTTTVWFKDMVNGRVIQMIQWGPHLYVPVSPGMRFGIAVYNGSDEWIAVPAYMEGQGFYDGAPADPNACTDNQMWEVRPGQVLVMDAFIDPEDQSNSRPFEVVTARSGFGIAQNTFPDHADELRGLLQVYRRTRLGRAVRSGYPSVPVPEPYPAPPVDFPYEAFGATREAYRGPESFGGGETFRGAGSSGGRATRGLRPKGVDPGPAPVGDRHQVAVGLGATERRSHSRTYIDYRDDAKLVAAVHIESQQDLAEVMLLAGKPSGTWFWKPPYATWYQDWPRPQLASQVPVAGGPHRGPTTN